MSPCNLEQYEALIETLREKARLASLRADISGAFNGSGALDDVLQACTEALVKNLNAAFARIWVLDRPGEVLELRASAGLYTHLDGPHGRVKVGDYKIGRIAKNLKAHVSNSVPTDPEVSNPEWAQREGMISFAGYPLTMEGKALGVVAFFSRETLSPAVLDELAPIADGIAQWIKRKQAETALVEQQEWLNVTLRSIGDAVVATDTQGHVTFLNPVAELLTGWTTAQALGQPLDGVFPIVHEETRHPVENPVAKALREKRIVGLANHTILISKAGDEWAIDDSASPIRDEKGEIIGVILVFHEITERRKAEREKDQALEAAQQAKAKLTAQANELEERVQERTARLEETVRSLEGVSYSIAHDLRGPLRSMEAFSSALLEDCPKELSPRAHAYAQKIAAAAHRMDTLIKELLGYGQLAHQNIPIERVSADEIVAHAITSLEATIQQSKAEITVSPLGDVLANPAILEQALTNLLTNAMKFVPPDSTPRIGISAERNEHRLRLRVQDHGIGIAAKHQERIFKLFERLDPKEYPGTGIGLAVVQKSVERMGGKVGVESTPNQGSTFWIELPSEP
jgi:PAS domain S-box-containing protein